VTSYHYIEDPKGLEDALAQLSGATHLYLDTEFESTREHIRLCLLQVGTPRGIFLIDAIKLPNLRILADVFANATWVVHAGTQDVPLILRAVGLTDLTRIFDTQIGYALVTAEANVSLAYLTYKLVGKREGKAHQADDWTRRPLSPEQLSYAAKDVEELPRIMDAIERRASGIDSRRFEAIFEASRESLAPSPRARTTLTLDMFRNAWQLGVAEQAGLRFLMDWFNELSLEEQEDAPDAKVLFSMASRMPTTRDVLLQLRGVPRGFAQRHHKRILDGLAEAARTSRQGGFVPIEPPPYATFEEFRVEAWLLSLRATLCEDLKVAPDFVLPSRILRDLRGALGRMDGTRGETPTRDLTSTLTGFRESLLASPMKALCDKTPPPL
jgi:ribonuclease D